MAAVIIMGVSILFLFIVIGVGYVIYSLISKKTMISDTKSKALDVFLYLGIAISLIWTVVNFLQIVFEAINRKFVDVLNAGMYIDSTSGDARLAIASLVVMFPIYIGLSWYVAKDIEKYHYKQDLAVRKIMIYLTLFITTLTLIGTLVSVIYKYLGGELSIRFGLQALTVFVTALALFWYYYYSLRRNYSVPTKTPLIASVIACIVVISALVWSISIIGTPGEMRLKRFDSQRLSDLSRIQQEVFNRFQMTDKLPLSLSELDNAFQGYTTPSDPITKEPYTYNVIQQPTVRMNYTTNKKELATAAIFEICANFETVRQLDARGQSVGGMGKGGAMMSDSLYSVTNYYYDGDQSPFWNHDA
jgi:hypothetical protein